MIGTDHITVEADHTSSGLPIAPPTDDLINKVMIGRVRSVGGGVQSLDHLGGIIGVMGGVRGRLQVADHSDLKTLRLAAWKLSDRPSRVLDFQRKLSAQRLRPPGLHQEEFDARWREHVSWCDEQGFNPIQATCQLGLGFSPREVKSLQLNSVLGYVTAISKRHSPVQGLPLSMSPA